MRLLIDTNAYSQLGIENTHILEAVECADEIVISSIVLGELYAGLGLGSMKAKNARELEQFLKQPGVSIVSPGTPMPTNDVWIAATALETASRIFGVWTPILSWFPAC